MEDLERFVEAQKRNYQRALEEIKSGKKKTHWIWYIYPQITGLGRSMTAKKYAIRNMDEAKKYLAHPILGKRLLEITEVLLQLSENNPEKIFGYPDDLKVRSCMTLFHMAAPEEKLFLSVLDKYYGGQKDGLTVEILTIEN